MLHAICIPFNPTDGIAAGKVTLAIDILRKVKQSREKLASGVIDRL
jgi:hypothetical protein